MQAQTHDVSRRDHSVGLWLALGLGVLAVSHFAGPVSLPDAVWRAAAAVKAASARIGMGCAHHHQQQTTAMGGDSHEEVRLTR